MSFTLLLAIVVVLGFALLLAAARRAELRTMEHSVKERDRVHRTASPDAQLQQPVIDLSRCLGCGKCVEVCPEKGVLELVHGQAIVVNGARCVGIAECERECPVGAITVTIANLEQRTDIPVLTEELESVATPGLFLAGEVTAHALVKTAVDHGREVAAAVARRREVAGPAAEGVLDLCIVGAGPAGLACSLEAKRLGLDFITLEHEQSLGGTVAKYPRRKLVLTQPIDLPLHGRLADATYTKEELMELWHAIAQKHALPIRGGERLVGVERDDDGNLVVATETNRYAARNVCLAVGRRGVPRRLGVVGEDLPKVAHSLLDAHSYQGRRVLVVGGGDSAVETALGLAEQPGNTVTLSYRRDDFTRIRARNQERIVAAIEDKTIDFVKRSEVVAIEPEAVELAVESDGKIEKRRIANDEVFVMVGGTAPTELLAKSGVSFDPTLRAPAQRLVEQGTGLVRALTAGFGFALAALLWVVWNLDYYLLPLAQRPTHLKHDLLRPGLGAGLVFGIATTVLISVNLLYLVRRSTRFKLRLGSLPLWMTSHVATGILALLCALLHAAMSPRETAGGHALTALVVLTVTGAIGRYFYSYVPRAANVRELELADLLARIAPPVDDGTTTDLAERRFREQARQEVAALIDARQWKSSLWKRVFALLGSQRDLQRVLRRLAHDGAAARIGAAPLRELLALARQAHRSALIAAHYEDLRAILNSWRHLHRWVAALMVLLVAIHVVCALIYGAFV